MPKQSKQSCNTRQNHHTKQVDRRRLALIDLILDESSSLKLNDLAKVQSPRESLELHTRLLDSLSELRAIESGLGPKLPIRTKESWAEFFTWLNGYLNDPLTASTAKIEDSIGVVQSQQIPSSNISEQEYGLHAKVPFKKDSTVFSIPRACMMTTETAMKDESLSNFIWNDSIASAMQNVVLVLHLLNEYSKGKNSPWAAYLSILPSRVLPVLQLDKEKLTCLLASSHIFEALKMIRAISRQYAYFFKRLQATNLALSKDFTLDYYCWGVSIVCSRQNEIPCEDRKTCLHPVANALIPILDMCNHSQLLNQASFENGHSSLITRKSLEIGEEIKINYGSRTSGDFYIHNGFVPEVVPFDEVPLTIALNANHDRLILLKTRLLKTLNMPNSGRFKLVKNVHETRHRRDPHLTMFLIVYCLNEEEVDFILDDENPVGIADSIYEYVQYQNKDGQSNGVSKRDDELHEETSQLMAVSRSVCAKIREYLDKRSKITIALIDRTLDTQSEWIDAQMLKLFEHEKSIYETHLIKY